MGCLLLLVIFCGTADPAGATQAQTFVTEIAEYRLTPPAFARFEHASTLISAAIRDDPRFIKNPLFTHEVAVSGDLDDSAAQLEARLRSEPALDGALVTARITAREYTTFALALIAARLAHGFVKSGVLRGVPAGVAADNVAFVDAHQAAIIDLLKRLGVETDP